jgi:signal peptidase II
LILFLTDQISKILVRGFSLPWFNINHNGLYPGNSKPLINNFLHLTIVENPGIAFGIDPGESLRDIILIMTILTCIGFVAYLIFAKSANKKTRIAVALILGGAAGNLFDRIFYGYFYNYAPLFQGKVVDFLDIRFFRLFIFNDIQGNYVLNFADLSILSGVFILIYLILRMTNQKKENSIVPELVENREDAA